MSPAIAPLMAQLSQVRPANEMEKVPLLPTTVVPEAAGAEQLPVCKGTPAEIT